MTRLSFREKVSCAPKVEISLADGKTGARPAELLKDGQALFGLLRVRFSQQISECAGSTASHASSELMKLRQTKLLRPADHNGVRPGDVEAAFYDIGRQKYVHFTFDKAHHPVINLVGRQSA